MDKSVAMTCGELAELVNAQPPDRPVVLSKDDECGPLVSAEEALYVAEDEDSGEVYPTPGRLAELVSQGRGWHPVKDAAPDGALPVLVLGAID